MNEKGNLDERGCAWGKVNRTNIENLSERLDKMATGERVDNLLKLVLGQADRLDRIQWLLVTNLTAIALGLLWMVLRNP